MTCESFYQNILTPACIYNLQNLSQITLGLTDPFGLLYRTQGKFKLTVFFLVPSLLQPHPVWCPPLPNGSSKPRGQTFPFSVISSHVIGDVCGTATNIASINSDSSRNLRVENSPKRVLGGSGEKTDMIRSARSRELSPEKETE